VLGHLRVADRDAPRLVSIAMTETSPIEHYTVPAGCCDELVENDGAPRPHVASLMATLQRLGPAALL